jgi:hypothetical protein
MRRNGRGSEAELRLGQARKQREVIRDVMLSAGQCATWLTLDELAKLTHYPPASISAQLRHLRKPRYGGFAVVKRCRAVDKAMRAEGFGALWEYSVQPVQRVIGKGSIPRGRSTAGPGSRCARQKIGVRERAAECCVPREERQRPARRHTWG